MTGIIPLIRNIVLFNKTFRVFIAQSAAGAKGMTAMRTAAIATGQSFRQAAVGVRILATAIRTVLVSSAIGIALVAISALIEKIMQLKATADSIEAQKGSYGERVLKAAESGGSEAMTTAQRNVEAERKSRQKGIDIAMKLSRGSYYGSGKSSSSRIGRLRRSLRKPSGARWWFWRKGKVSWKQSLW